MFWLSNIKLYTRVWGNLGCSLGGEIMKTSHRNFIYMVLGLVMMGFGMHYYFIGRLQLMSLCLLSFVTNISSVLGLIVFVTAKTKSFLDWLMFIVFTIGTLSSASFPVYLGLEILNLFRR